MKYFLFILFLIFCEGCSTSKINLHAQGERTRLFPNGVYYHDVTLNVKPTSQEPKKYNFQGIVRISDDKIEIVALSFFGTTEFKMVENIRTAQIICDIYREGLKKFEPQLKNLYSTLHTVLLAEGSPAQMTVSQEGVQINFEFSGYDQNKIPERIEIIHPQFKVSVKIKRYEI